MAQGIADDELGRHMLRYITEQTSLPPERIEDAMLRTGADPETTEALMGTAAAIWMQEGEARGEVRGKSETLSRLLRRRFGPLPEDVRERVAQAGVEQLDRWLDRVIDASALDASSLDAIFGSGPKR